MNITMKDEKIRLIRFFRSCQEWGDDTDTIKRKMNKLVKNGWTIFTKIDQEEKSYLLDVIADRDVEIENECWGR